MSHNDRMWVKYHVMALVMYISLCYVYMSLDYNIFFFFFFQAEDGIRDYKVTGVQTCALPISLNAPRVNAELVAVVDVVFGVKGGAAGGGYAQVDHRLLADVVERVAEEIGRASCRERV